LLAEVVYDAGNDPDMLQWVKIYNPCSRTIDLSGYTIGYGGTFYGEAQRTKALSGSVASDDCFLVGGPTSSVLNGDPTLDLPEDFMPSLSTAESTGNAVALFELPPAQIGPSTTPLDAVIYGPNNDNALLDASGTAPSDAMVANPPQNGSIQRESMDAAWTTSLAPAPNMCPPY